ncbi:pi16 [Pungitius sinensis]
MHQRSPSELQGASNRRTAARAGAPLWTWLLLGALAVPGARSSLSEEEEELVVELHNHYRGQVFPSASAMLPLRWDPSLKIIAEGYAAKCIWNHNPALEDTGENLFAGTGPLDLREALEKWFLERLDFHFQNNTCNEDQMCGHYTQMVWADTHRVGCAFHLCNNMEGLDWEKASFLVCNYYPAGNYEEQRPYVEGEWCSRCPDNFQKCENNLCVADTVENDDDEGDEVDDEAGTSGPSVQPKGEKEQEAVVPPAGTSGPSLQPEGEKEQEADLPPAGTSGTSALAEGEDVGPNVQPPTTTSPASTPSISTITAEGDSADLQPPATPAPGTQPPEDHPTPEEKEKKGADEMVEVKKKDPFNKKAVKEERDGGRNLAHSPEGSSAASTSSHPLLLACLTGLLTLRL